MQKLKIYQLAGDSCPPNRYRCFYIWPNNLWIELESSLIELESSPIKLESSSIQL